MSLNLSTGSPYSARLLSAPEASRLQSYVSSSTVPAEITENATIRRRVRSTNAPSAFYNCFSGLFPITLQHHRHSVSSCCFLHATLDLLCYVAITQGRQPALLACWNFVNGGINTYGTSVVAGNRVFYVTEAAGLYVFACDEASELCSWIHRATRSACHLENRHWLCSVPFDGDRGRGVPNASKVLKHCLMAFYAAWQQWCGACARAWTVW